MKRHPLRVLLRLLVCCCLIVLCLLDFILFIWLRGKARSARARAEWLQRWSRRHLRNLNAEIKRHGEAPQGGLLEYWRILRRRKGTLILIATLGLLARDYIPADFAMPVGEIVLDVCGFLLTPLAVGMVLGRMLPTWRKRISKTAVRVGFVVVAAMVLCSLASGRIKPGEHGWRVPLAVIAFCLVGMQLNMLPFRLCRWPREDTVAAGIEVTMRNMNLALLLKAVLFPEDGSLASLGPEVLFVILFYAAVAMGAGLPLSLNFRRWAKDS